MKIVDVDLFQDGVQRNITMLDRLSSEVEAIEHAVNGLVQMEEQLKGAGVVPYVPFTRNVIYPSFIFFSRLPSSSNVCFSRWRQHFIHSNLLQLVT